MVLEITSRTDKQTHRQMDTHTYTDVLITILCKIATTPMGELTNSDKLVNEHYRYKQIHIEPTVHTL